MANTTASGVSLPAKPVAAPIESAVATAGAMCVIDWKRTSGRPMASRLSALPPSAGTVVAVMPALLRASGPPSKVAALRGCALS